MNFMDGCRRARQEVDAKTHDGVLGVTTPISTEGGDEGGTITPMLPASQTRPIAPGAAGVASA